MAGYTRQSSFADGDTITAALFNDEYNQLVNAFSNTTGHSHDGTAASGPVIGLIGDAGETSPNNKVLIDTTNNYIEFYVEVSSSPVQQLYIADGAIIPVTDSDVDLGTSSLYFKDSYIDTVTTTGNVSVGGNLTVTGNATISGNLTFGDADTDSINLAAEIDSNVIPNTDNTYDLGSSTKEWKDIYIDGTAYLDAINFNGTAITSTAAELNILDGVTSTATELNIVDGDTSATSTTLADADRVVVNDNGTMVQVALTDFETYFESALDTLSNVTTVGALNSGSITSGFGSIDNGSSAITTTGTITYGSLSDGTITITAFADEDDMSSNSATLVPTQQSVKAYVDSQVTAQDLDFQGDSGGALSIDLDSETLTIAGGTGIDTTGATNTLTIAIDSTVATLTGSQTLTNKTLTSPVISSISNTGTLTLPTSTDTLVGRATTDTLTNKTLTSPVINGSVSGTAILDNDAFDNASATTLATSESIKAYVDAQILTEDTLAELNDTNITSPAGGALLFYEATTAQWIDNVVSGDITMTSGGVATIAAGSVENSMLAGSIANDKLANSTIGIGGIDFSLGSSDATPALDLTDATNYPTSSLTGTITNAQLAGSIANSKLANSSITVADSGGVNSTAIALGGTITFAGTSNEIEVAESSGTITYGLPNDVTIGNDLTVTGDLTVNGTTTTVNSTTVTVDDPIFTLGGDSAPASDDNKDRGIEFRWHNGSAAKVGFFGYDDSASVFTFIPDATNTSEVFSGSAGNVAFGNIAGTLTTAAQTNITSVGTLSSATISGDLTVDTSTLKVDSTNNRVGIGNASPDVSLDLGSNTDSIHVPVGTTAQRPSSPAAGYFRYNSTTGGFEGYTTEWGAIAGSGSGGSSSSFTRDEFTGDGSTTAFTLSKSIAANNEDRLIIFNEGVFQRQDSYTLSGTTLTFDTAPANGNKIVAYIMEVGVVGADPTVATMTGDGSDTTLDLTVTPSHENATFVTIDGVFQHKDTYSVSGSTLTFSAAPPNGSAVECTTFTTTTLTNVAIVQDTDQDTKIQVEESSDEDKIRFDVGGSEKVVIDSTGLGVGTSSPSTPLDVVGSTGLRVNEDGSSTKVINLRSNFAGVGPAVNVSSNHPLLLMTNNTERVRVLSSGGITFNGDTAAANALDDYEEGTWTPSFNSSNFGTAVTVNSSRYVKIGSQVLVEAQVTFSGTGSSSAASNGDYFILNGLPFTSGSTSYGGGSFWQSSSWAGGNRNIGMTMGLTSDTVCYGTVVNAAGSVARSTSLQLMLVYSTH